MNRMMALSLALALLQQPPDDLLEAVSIRANPAAAVPRVRVSPGGTFTATGVTMVDLLWGAYAAEGIQKSSQIVGGPAWLASDRFDVTAKATRAFPADPIEAGGCSQPCCAPCSPIASS